MLRVAASTARLTSTKQKAPFLSSKKTFLKNGILFVLQKIKNEFRKGSPEPPPKKGL
jgi:hypothetical protein